MENFERFNGIRNFDGRKIFPDIALFSVIGVSLLLIANLIKNFPIFYTTLAAPEAIWSLVGIALLVIIFVSIKPIIKYLWHLFFSILPLSKTANFNYSPPANLNQLLFQGKVDILTGETIKLTNSGSGFVFKGLWWKDFITTFEFNFEYLETSFINWWDNESKSIKPIPHRFNFLGITFRAQSLEDYFMISIGILKSNTDYQKEKNKNLLSVLITPHIRLGGTWERFGGQDLLTKIKVNDFNKVKITVIKSKAIVEINNKSLEWNLPTNFERVSSNTYDPQRTSNVNNTKIPFRNSFGMIGFRADGAEHAQIKNINIKRM
ncbi:MAG TPA: hypothetical protein VMR59_01490 [Patescibacteria group bacterium]|nr:hypothetical protein [Patescibacteria group bacterium]